MSTAKNTTVNFDTLAAQLTPIAMRKPVWNALMRVFMTPFRRIGTDQAAFQALKRLRMAHNGQVRLLEHVANLLMIGSYDPVDPVIRLDEPVSVEEFLIAPNGDWALQNSIHYNRTAKDHWEYYNRAEASELFGVLYDADDHVGGLGFEVHLAPCLSETAPRNTTRDIFIRNGGKPALRDIIDTYKLAGKQYTLIQD
jgi:hypothetical protein